MKTLKAVSIFILIILITLSIREFLDLSYYSFRTLTPQGEKYVLEDLSKSSLCAEDELCFFRSTSPMKIDYISVNTGSFLFKYKISCNNFSYIVLVSGHSAISDTLDKKFEAPKPKIIY